MTELTISYRDRIQLSRILNRYLEDHPQGESAGFAASLLGRINNLDKKPLGVYRLDQADLGIGM